MAIDKLPEDIVQRPEDISHDQPRIHTEPFFRDGQSEMKMILENVDNPITVGSAIVSIVIKRDGAALPANKGYFEDYQKVFQTQFKPFFIPATKGTYVAEVVFADSSKVYTTKPLVVEEAKEDDDVLACPMINSTAGGKVFYTIDVKDKKYVKRITVKYTNGSRDQVFEYKALQSAILHQNVVVGNANNTIVITGSNTFTAEVEFYNSLKTYITKPHGANGIIDKDSATFDLYYDDDFDDVDVNRHWWARMLRANFDSLAGVEKVEVLLTPYWDPARGVEFVEKTITQIDGLKSLQVEMNQSSHRAGLRRYKIYRRVNGSIVADIHSSYINAFTLVIGHWWYHNSMDKISSLGGVLNTHIFMHSGSKDELSPADMKILIPSDNIFIDIRKTTGTKERDLPFTLDYGEKGNVSKNRINVSVDLSSISQEDRMYIIWNELHCLTKTLVDRNDPTSIIDGTFNEAHSLRRFDNRVIVPKKFEMRPIDVNAIVENGICKIRTASKFDSLVSETKYSTVAKNADGAGLTSELTNLENMNWIRHYQPYINTKLIKPKIGATLNISQAAVYKDDHARQEITASFDMPIVNELSGSHYKLEPYFHTKLLVNGVPTYTPIPFNADGEQDIYLDFAEPLEVYVLEKNKQGQKYVQVKMMYHDDVSYNALTPSPTAYGRAKAIHIKMREYHGLLHDVSRPVLPLDEMNQFAIGTNTVDGLPENRKAGHSGYYSNHELNEYGVETSDGVQLPPEFLKSYISRKQMSYTFSPTTGIDVSLLDPSLYPSDGELRMEPDQANTENKKATGKWFGMVQYPDSKYSGITPVLNVRVDKFGNKTPHKLALVSNQLAMDGKTSVELSLTIDEVMPSAIQSENADFSAHLWYRPNDVNGRFEKIKIFNGRVDNKTITADDFKINGVPSNRFKIAIGSDLASIGSYFFQVNFSNTQDFKSSGVVGSGPFDIPDFQNPYKVQVSNTITLIKAMDSSIEYYPNDDSVIQIASMLEFKFEERTVNGVVEKYATNIPNSLIQLDDKDNILIGNVPEYLKKEAGSFGQASDGSWGVTGGKPNRISISSLAKGYKSFYDRNNRSSLHGIAIVAPDGEIMNYELDSNTGEEYFTYASAKVKGIQRGETSAAFLFSQGIHRIVYIHKLLNITRNLYDYKFQPDQYYTATAEMAFLVEPHQIVVELFKDNTLVPLNRTDVAGGYTLSSPNSNISVNVEIIHKTRIVKTIIDFKTMNEGGVDDSGQYHIQYKIKTGVMNDPVEQIRYTTAKSMVLKYDPVIVTKLRGLVSIAVSNIRLQAGTVAISSSIEAVVAELFMLRLGISVSDYPIKISVRHIAPLGALTLFATNESSSKKGVISFNLNSISPDKPEDIIVEIAHEAAHAVANIEGAFGYGPFFAHGKRFLQTNLLLRYLLGVPVTENWTKFTNAYGIQVYGIGYSQETKGMANAERLAFDGHLLDESIQAAYGAPEKSRYTTKLGTIGGDNPAEKDMWNRTPSMDAVPGESLNAGINDLHPESPDISEDPTSKIYKDFRYESKLISQEDIDYGLYPQEDLDKKAPVRVRFKLNNNLIQDLNGNMVRANNYYVVSWVVQGSGLGFPLYEDRDTPMGLLDMYGVGVEQVGKPHIVNGKTLNTYLLPHTGTDPLMVSNNKIKSLEPTGFNSEAIFIKQPATTGEKYADADMVFDFDITENLREDQADVVLYAQILTDAGMQYTPFVFCRPQVPDTLEINIGNSGKKAVGKNINKINPSSTVNVYNSNKYGTSSRLPRDKMVIFSTGEFDREGSVVGFSEYANDKYLTLTKIIANSSAKNALCDSISIIVAGDIGDIVTSVTYSLGNRERDKQMANRGFPLDPIRSNKVQFNASENKTVYTVELDTPIGFGAFSNKPVSVFANMPVELPGGALYAQRLYKDKAGKPSSDKSHSYVFELSNKRVVPSISMSNKMLFEPRSSASSRKAEHATYKTKQVILNSYRFSAAKNKTTKYLKLTK